MNKPCILIFGAGKIGRSFIGQVFGKNDYDVVFVDMDKSLVDELNRRKQYPVIIKGAEYEERIIVERVSAIYAPDREEVIRSITNASIMAVSVGKNALSAIAGVIAEGLIRREEFHPGRTLDIILAENMRSADLFLRDKLRDALPPSFPLDKQVGLVETSIGKMVPIMTAADLAEDPLQVFAEPYNTLILDQKGFRGEIPGIPELALKENMKAWVDRKAFIHNMGHATAAYCGYLNHPEAIYLFEVLEDPEVLNFTREVMQESGRVLKSLYPEEFSEEDLDAHIDDLLLRFRNQKLGDTLFRVGSDLQRKLGADDRFQAVIRLALSKQMACGRIIEAMSMGFRFKATNEEGHLFPGDAEFHALLNKNPDQVLSKVCALIPGVHDSIIKPLREQLFA